MRTPSRSCGGSRQTPRNYFAHQVISARKGIIAYLPLIMAVGVLLTATMVGAYFVIPDVLNYQCYATAFWFGAQTSQLLPASQCQFIPQISQYHTLPLEYPPLTLFIFSLPLLVPVVNYTLMFALFMAVIVSFIYWLLLKYGPHGAGVIFAACLLVGCLATTLARFDMFPAALTLLCVIWAERKHWTLAYGALALGVLTKLYPIVLFPLLFLAEQRDRVGFFIPDQSIMLKTAPTVFLHSVRSMRSWCWKNGLMFIGLVLGVTACFGVLISKGAFNSLSYLYFRPFQVESIGSVLLWLASLLGVPVERKNSFGSLNTLSPIAGGVSQFLVILLCMGYIFIVIQQWKGKMNFVQAFLAMLLVLVSTSKVFSPEYLLWLIPLLAYSATGNRKLWLYWGGISILTTLIYPIYYGVIANLNGSFLDSGFLPVILLRDGLFVLLTIGYLFNFLNLRESSDLPSGCCGS
ncbi:MAG: glycosyltransferase family 87 protein [Anaerolineales bacterium]